MSDSLSERVDQLMAAVHRDCLSQADRDARDRRIKSLCGQIFLLGTSVGWDKHVAVVAQRDSEIALAQARDASLARHPSGQDKGDQQS